MEVLISKKFRVNQEIRVRDVRVVDEQGAMLGVMPIREALRLAEERMRDLVEISPNADPPVCKLMDFGRYKYETAKKDREARAKRKIVELREVTMRPKIDDHDFQVKHRTARRLLTEGDKVKITVRFRGREMAHPELAMELLQGLYKELQDVAIQERAPGMEGRFMHMILAPREVQQQQPAQGQPGAAPPAQERGPHPGGHQGQGAPQQHPPPQQQVRTPAPHHS